MLSAHTPDVMKPSSSAAPDVIRSFSPTTGDELGSVPVMTAAQVAATVARARVAQEKWAQVSIVDRASQLLRFRNVLVDRVEEVVAILGKEVGKVRHEALSHEILVIADVCTFLAKRAERILAPQKISLHLLRHRRSFVDYEPRGVVGIIGPWNFPFKIPVRDAMAALVAGNAVVLKPSELAPLVMLKAKELWEASGGDPDLFQVVTGFAPTGRALISADINYLIFTGGVETGRRVAAACGEALIPCVLELGGKAPLIACADADVERTARAIVWGGFANLGQVCTSVERVYAHASIHDSLLARTVELANELKQGNPVTEVVELGSIVLPPLMDVADKHIADALSKGAKLCTGGKRISGPGNHYEPTVLSNCDHSMTVMTQEIFGPVVPFMSVTSDEEAIRLANDSHLGLNAYVFSKDTAHGHRVAKKVQAGAVIVNDVLINGGCPDSPFGGIKKSGFGRVNGEDSLRQMCTAKHIMTDRLVVASEPFWFPYTDKTYGLLRSGLAALFSGKGLIGKIAGWFL